MTKSLAVVGCSDHGKVVADAAIERGWRKIAFYDDAWPGLAQVGRWTVEGGTAELKEILNRFDSVIVGIEENRPRLAKLAELEAQGAALCIVVHPGAMVSHFADVGLGTVVFAAAVVNVDAQLGRGVIVHTGATVGRDCVLEDGVHIGPGAHLAGGVKVGAGSLVGIGATVRGGVNIGQDALVAAGAVVIRDVPDGVTVMGVPARVS